MKKLLVGIMALVMSLSINAQCHGGQNHEGGCPKAKAGKCCKMLTPEDKAKKLVERFNLSDEKASELVKFYKDQDAQRQKAMVAKAKREAKEREDMKKAMAKSEQKLGKIIGAENLKTLQQEREERVKAHQAHHSQQAGKGPHKDCNGGHHHQPHDAK